jgi:hypothetical protein
MSSISLVLEMTNLSSPLMHINVVCPTFFSFIFVFFVGYIQMVSRQKHKGTEHDALLAHTTILDGVSCPRRLGWVGIEISASRKAAKTTVNPEFHETRHSLLARGRSIQKEKKLVGLVRPTSNSLKHTTGAE